MHLTFTVEQQPHHLIGHLGAVWRTAVLLDGQEVMVTLEDSVDAALDYCVLTRSFAS